MSGAGEGGNAGTRSHYCNAIFMGGDRRHTSFGVFLLSSSLKSVNVTTWCTTDLQLHHCGWTRRDSTLSVSLSPADINTAAPPPAPAARGTLHAAAMNVHYALNEISRKFSQYCGKTLKLS